MQDNVQMILANNFATPKVFETSVVNYLQAAGCKIDQSKSIAAGTFTDQRVVAGAQNAMFFNQGSAGAFNQSLTTVPNSYQLNDGEHKIIYGMKIYDAVNATIAASDWVAGANAAEIKNCRISFSNNGVNVMAPTLGTAFQPDLTDQEIGLFFFKPYIIWAGQTNIQVPVTFPIVPIANQNMMIELYWVGLIS